MTQDKKILEKAQEVFQIEAAALDAIGNRLGGEFVQVIDWMRAAQKVVVVGVGKSAHIGKKIVATFNSTGTVAQYLHATEAIHGDLGMVQSGDVVLAISKSGNTQEIKDILPFLKQIAFKVVAITGNLESHLAQTAHAVLDVSVAQEACPNNLAPTTSTTAQLAMGDALAVVLMQQRNFTAADFARFHPGGALGKKLLLVVKDVVPPKEKPFVHPEDSISKVIESLSYAKNGITVLLEDGKVVGVITDGDMRRMLTKYPDFSSLTAKDIASNNPKTIREDSLASEAFRLLRENNIGQLVVLDDTNQYSGILDIHDLLKQGIS